MVALCLGECPLTEHPRINWERKSFNIASSLSYLNEFTTHPQITPLYWHFSLRPSVIIDDSDGVSKVFIVDAYHLVYIWRTNWFLMNFLNVGQFRGAVFLDSSSFTKELRFQSFCWQQSLNSAPPACPVFLRYSPSNGKAMIQIACSHRQTTHQREATPLVHCV